MSGMHRQRPGATGMQAATDSPPVDLGDDVWMSPGWSNSYLLPTDEGRVVINTGMGFEGPLHRRAYDTVDTSPIHSVILTQGHYDHVGGIDAVKDPETAQAAAFPIMAPLVFASTVFVICAWRFICALRIRRFPSSTRVVAVRFEFGVQLLVDGILARRAQPV